MEQVKVINYYLQNGSFIGIDKLGLDFGEGKSVLSQCYEALGYRECQGFSADEIAYVCVAWLVRDEEFLCSRGLDSESKVKELLKCVRKRPTSAFIRTKFSPVSGLTGVLLEYVWFSGLCKVQLDDGVTDFRSYLLSNLESLPKSFDDFVSMVSRIVPTFMFRVNSEYEGISIVDGFIYTNTELSSGDLTEALNNTYKKVWEFLTVFPRRFYKKIASMVISIVGVFSDSKDLYLPKFLELIEFAGAYDVSVKELLRIYGFILPDLEASYEKTGSIFMTLNGLNQTYAVDKLTDFGLHVFENRGTEDGDLEFSMHLVSLKKENSLGGSVDAIRSF